MSTFAKLSLAAGAVVVVGVMAVMLGGRGVGVESTAASPTVPAPNGTSPQPSATASEGASAPVPGEFTVCVPHNSPLRSGTDEQFVVPHPDGDMTVERQRGYTWAGTITATDPRFSGTHYYSWDGDTYTLASGDDGPQVAADGLRIENDEGAWQGSGTSATLPDGTSAYSPLVLTGEGAFEGLTAILVGIEDSCFFDFRGIVMEFPDPPVPATSE
jgi:hypothetical protein